MTDEEAVKARYPDAELGYSRWGVQQDSELATPPVEGGEVAAQTFEEWLKQDYPDIARRGNNLFRSVAKGMEAAWNAAKASSPETDESLPNGKPNTPENALLLRWNKAAAGAGMAGSEYVDDPERVFARVRENREAMMRSLVAAKKASSPQIAQQESPCPCMVTDGGYVYLHHVPGCPSSSPAVAGGESETESVSAQEFIDELYKEYSGDGSFTHKQLRGILNAIQPRLLIKDVRGKE